MPEDKARRKSFLLARGVSAKNIEEWERLLNRETSIDRPSSLSDNGCFEIYLATLRKGSFFAPGLTVKQIGEWERDASRKPLIDRAKADWKERSDRITASIIAADDDPNWIVFNSKILLKLERDITSGELFAEATLAAMNLPGWADTIARYARAAANPKQAARVKAFFVELGKALQAERRLWDGIDELIATNYYASKQFKVPLCEMTESEASKLVNLTLAAYDRRLLRLGIRKDKVGRPAKRDKKSK